MKKLLIIISILLLPVSALGVTVYVDSSVTAGADCSGDYSIANRECNGADGDSFNTIQEAVDVATSSGDVVSVRAGDYWEGDVAQTWESFRTVANNVTIQIHSGETVTVGRVIILHDNITVDGFRVKGPDAHNTAELVLVSGDNNTVKNCFLFNGWGHHGSSNMNGKGIKINGDGNIIQDNELVGPRIAFGTHDGAENAATLSDSTASFVVDALIGERLLNGSDTAGAGGTDSYCVITDNTETTITCTLAEGSKNEWDSGDIYLVGGSFYLPIQFQNATNATLSGNVIHNLWSVERAYDFAAQNSGHVIDDDEVFDVQASGFGEHMDVFQFAGTFTTDFARDITFQNNFFHDMNSQFGINGCQGASKCDDPETDIARWYFYNNVIANLVEFTAQTGSFEGRFYNNIFYNVGGDASGDYFGCTIVVDVIDPTGTIFKNNIIIQKNTAGAADGYGTGNGNCVYTNNYSGTITFGSRDAIPGSDNVNGGNPQFIAPFTDCINNTCNFDLLATSVLIDEGTTVVDFSVDKDGSTRTEPWDIGPYEFDSVFATISGTVQAGGVTEAEIVTGGETIIITLTGDAWVATVGADNAITDALIAGIDSGTAQPAGWDAVVKANMVFGDVTRTSGTVVTITLAAEAGYSIVDNETITVTISATALTGAVQLIATPTFEITALDVTATLAANFTTESEVVAGQTGSKTIIITLSQDTWVATMGDDVQATTDLIGAITSAQSEATGWNAVVRAGLDFNNVTRDSDTQVTIALNDEATYDISANESVTIAIPNNGLVTTGTGTITVTPTVTIIFFDTSTEESTGLSLTGVSMQ